MRKKVKLIIDQHKPSEIIIVNLVTWPLRLICSRFEAYTGFFHFKVVLSFAFEATWHFLYSFFNVLYLKKNFALDILFSLPFAIVLKYADQMAWPFIRVILHIKQSIKGITFNNYYSTNMWFRLDNDLQIWKTYESRSYAKDALSRPLHWVLKHIVLNDFKSSIIVWWNGSKRMILGYR